MGNDEFKVLIEAILDKTKIPKDAAEVQKLIQKYPAEFEAKLKTSNLKKDTEEVRKVIKSLAESMNIEMNDKQITSVLNSFITKTQQLETQIDKVKTKLNSSIQYKLDVGDYDTQIAKIQNSFSKLSLSTEESKTKISSLTTAYLNLQNAKSVDERIKAEQKFQTELAKTKNELTKTQLIYSTAFKPITELQRINFSTKMQKWLDTNTAASKKFGVRIRELIEQCATLDGSGFYKLEAQFKSIINEAATAGKVGKSFGDTMKTGMQKFSEWGMASRIVMGIVQSVKDMSTNAYKLDGSLLELSKVSDLSANGLRNITEEAYALGETVGKTGTQVIDGVTEFKRAGYELKDSMDMAESALVMTNVAEGITETSDAAGTLISVLKGFKMEASETMSIVDMMNSVSNQSPVSFDNLADGLERTSGTMEQAGNTIQQTLGLLTGGYAQLRNIEKVSSGMIFIQQRLRGVDEDGTAIEGLSSKLKESFSEIGVATENADGSLRSMYQIATDYAKVLPTLTSKQKQYYGELAAGNRQITVWNAITEQIADVEKATNQATNSLGSSAEENEKYLNSLSGKTAQFQSAFEHLSKTVLDSDMLKFFVDLGTTGVSAIDSLVGALTPLGAAGVIGGIGLFIKNLDWLKMRSYKILPRFLVGLV